MKTEDINIKEKLYYKYETESTNIDAMNCENAPDGSVFMAEIQTRGRGSRGRVWQSKEGNGIWMSILLFPKMNACDIPKITLTAGLAVCKVLKEAGFDAGIKWPNDIVISGKKVCGILTEKKNERVAVGIGVNVNTESFDGELKERATSLYIESGIKRAREELASLIAESFDKFYTILKEDGFSALKEEYKENCITLGKKVKVIQPGEEYRAEAVDITSDGELEIDRDGMRVKLCSGEVSVRGIYGYV